MFWPAPASFRAQAAIIAAASLAVVGLTVFIVRNVISQTEGALLADARQTCVLACLELRVQYEERTTYGSDLAAIPPEAQDLSLTGICATVLRSFERVEGGIYLMKEERLSGYANPSDATSTRPRPRGPRLDFIRSLAKRATATNEVVTQTNPLDANYYIMWAAVRSKSGGAVMWTSRRVAVPRDPLAASGRWWLAALVLLTVLGMFGSGSIWYMLRSGVGGINRGLQRLEGDFNHRLPLIKGDLGEIAMAINRMAERRVTLEAELRKQDRLAALGKVVSGVAHEIRNPLNSMKLTLQLLDRRLKKGAPVAHEIQEALHEIDRLDLIVGRLLAFGRQTMTDRQVQELAPLFDQAVKMVAEPASKKVVSIQVEKDAGRLTADIDGPQIVQVLINLLLNAIDASPSSSTVRITAESGVSGVRIRVSDKGSGIAEEAQPHIFDAYFTTKPNGSGLGLAVSREIVASHGGTLEFETSPTGTSFLLQLPIDRSRPL